MTTGGDRQERFAAQLASIQRQLFGYIFALLRNLDDAQEVYQQTCLVMWRKYDAFAGRSSFATWACGIARYKVAEFRRQQRRHQAHFSSALEEQIADLQMQAATPVLDARRAALNSCMAKLTPSEQALLRDCYGSARSVSEVAAERKRSVQSVYNSLRRLRQRLLECIDRAVAREEHA